MKCPNCGEMSSDKCKFCGVCGEKLSASPEGVPVMAEPAGERFEPESGSDAIPEPLVSAPSPVGMAQKIKNKFCRLCGGEVDPVTLKCLGCGRKATLFSTKTFLYISLALLVGATVLLFVQHSAYARKELTYQDDLSSKEASIEKMQGDSVLQKTQVSNLYKQINGLNKQITNLNNKIEAYKSYQVDSETLDEILTYLQSSNAGFASSKFKASDKIFVVDRFDTQTSFTLTCDFSGSTSIYTSNKGNSATIDFSQDKWYGATTKLFIYPKSVGTTIVTFSNSQNTQTFKILIVVID